MYALVDCNNFYASCERVFAPALRSKPVVILSNNDGCIISRSDEAKALGFPMGGAIFQYDSLAKRDGVVVCSSNYPLYGDMSRRVMEVLRMFATDCEVYSIDESFLHWRHTPRALMAYGRRIRDTVFQWTGLPVSIGFGATKTLAKAANRLAKKNDGVFYLVPEDRSTLSSLPVASLWGVGSRSTEKLIKQGIYTAYDLQQAEDESIRALMTVCGQRMVLELRGTSCLELETVRPQKKEICCTRSFGKMLSSREDLREAVATFASRAAEKLRDDESVAGIVHVLIETNGHRKDLEQYASGATGRLGIATNYTPSIVRAALACFEDVFREGYWYKRAGVMLLDICPKKHVQQDLFHSDAHRSKHERAMKAMDGLNRRFGRNAVSPAAVGIRRAYRMNQQRLSPCYTTRWDDVVKVKI